ncbi:MAG TPA: hypothetical protein VM029_05365, partial [Opitutaceae bacterium]|nr:hypothetical protein [Opitutaceae bacterium]
MPKATSNKSMRTEQPNKALRRTSVSEGEVDQQNQAPGAASKPQAKRRPGRTASLLTSLATKRSNRWRNPEKGGPNRRRGNLAKGTRTGR